MLRPSSTSICWNRRRLIIGYTAHNNNNKYYSPKSFQRYRKAGECTLPLHVLAVACTDTLHTTVMQVITSPPQTHLGRMHRYPKVGECTLPLHVLAGACTVHNEALRSIMGCYGSVTRHYGTLWKHCGSFMGCCEALQKFTERCMTLQDVMERYGLLRNVMGLLRSSYGTLRNHYGKYWFCPSLTEF